MLVLLKHRPKRLLQPLHTEAFGGHFMVVLVRFTVFWIHGGLGAWGARNGVPPLTDTHTLRRRVDRTQKTKVFWELLKHPTSKDNEGYMDQKLWGIVSIQTRQCPKCEIPEL